MLISFNSLIYFYQFSSVQFTCSVMSNSATPWTAAHQASLFIINSWSLLKLMSIEWVMPSHHLILCCPLFLLPSSFPIIRIFSNESALHIKWSKYWSFSFSISRSNEYSGLMGDLTSPFTVVELVWKSCRVLVCLCISVSVVEKEVI